jgi:hypothetical protein
MFSAVYNCVANNSECSCAESRYAEYLIYVVCDSNNG